MKRKTTLKWFTLLEMIIVMVIIGILAVVLSESYITISKIALKVEQEKNISEESLVLTQVFQAISDEATIDYEAYSLDEGINLNESTWFVDILYLTWWQRSWTSIYTTGECLDLEWNFLANENWMYDNPSNKLQQYSGCYIALEQNGEITPLTTPWKVIISKTKFRVIPYDSEENYYSDKYDGDLEDNRWFIINNIHQPAFWLFIHLYAPLYQPTWTNKIDQPLQLFFNLNL